MNDLNRFLCFQLDLKKMPLGKLSKKQIEKAFGILGEAQRLLDEGGPMESIHPQILDCSNRFYTLIPHDCGLGTPPLLNDPNLIKVGKLPTSMAILIIPKHSRTSL